MQTLVTAAVNCFTICSTGTTYLLSSVCTTGWWLVKKKIHSNKTLPEKPLGVSKLNKYIFIYERRQNQKIKKEQLFFCSWLLGDKGRAIVTCAGLFHKCEINVHPLLSIKQRCESLGTHRGWDGGVKVCVDTEEKLKIS